MCFQLAKLEINTNGSILVNEEMWVWLWKSNTRDIGIDYWSIRRKRDFDFGNQKPEEILYTCIKFDCSEESDILSWESNTSEDSTLALNFEK